MAINAHSSFRRDQIRIVIQSLPRQNLPVIKSLRLALEG
jgi:hypothetical protein